MAKSDQPSASTQRKPISSAGKPTETGKKNSPELTDDELSKVSGGSSGLPTGKRFFASSSRLRLGRLDRPSVAIQYQG
jgi:bacteriocin-like protein